MAPAGETVVQRIATFPSQPRDPDPETYVAPSDTQLARKYELPPRRKVPNVALDRPEILANFTKGWNKAWNYTGEPYDILFDKARAFMGYCHRMGISESQYHAVFPQILDGRAADFYLYYIGPDRRWDEIYNLLNAHFNTNTNNSQYWTDWTSITFRGMQREFPDEKPQAVLEKMLDKLQRVQRALGQGSNGEQHLRAQVARACFGVPEFDLALVRQQETCEGFFADLRACLQVANVRQNQASQYYIDRRYTNNQRQNKFQGRLPYRTQGNSSFARPNRSSQNRRFNSRANKRCFVCKKEGCWSTNHRSDEVAQAKMQYLASCEDHDCELPWTEGGFDAFLSSYEGQDEMYESADEGPSISEEDGEQAAQ
ncbi:hypothetical protein CDD82_2448 [Ophiocordyceps australis]|uniref:Uncharacterized protein n=1 Tax=Ophiocordyceps australis TaxID=1399860 RepID=A0A2C5XX33_9HYPO|nr:hypothetical protein CDD82_2448 [Ophiocordyceps australis]